MIRRSAVAGTFYPGSRSELKTMLKEFIDHDIPKRKAIAIISPHAGYIYSGRVAGKIFSSVELPRDFIILSPNHTGLGARAALMDSGHWETPMGPAEVNSGLAHLLKNHCSSLEVDSIAHQREHSLEVQLPFLQYLLTDFSFVPICISTQNYDELCQIGKGIAASVQEYENSVLILVSSDMTHYEDAESAKKKDMKAIKMVEKVDPRGLYDVVRKEGITMCGFAPAVSALEACRILGARKGNLIAYATSGDETGDYGSVVAYAGLLVN
jgi:AmmeMemoRadiSam system protein B